MMTPLRVFNGDAVELRNIPSLDLVEFRHTLVAAVHAGGRLVSLFGVPSGNGHIQLFSVLAQDSSGDLVLFRAEVKDKYPALTQDCLQAHWFEREIAEQWGVIPQGHPQLDPIRFHRSYSPDKDAWQRDQAAVILPSVKGFFKVDGAQVHEVAVGPVHAGIIEPGHFRFQCQGEEVFHLEISLGYQHRGVEPALIGGPTARTIPYIETLAGDTSIGNALAYAQIIEALGNTRVSGRAEFLRGIALELERLANHVGDLGAMANDIGFLPTSSYCGRLRGDFLNMTALICGSRFGRGLVRPGGLAFDVDPAIIGELKVRLRDARQDVTNALNLLWDDPLVVDRLENTGIISKSMAQAIGLVGPAARAAGLERDARFTHPTGIYRLAQVPVATYSSGDVFGRAYVRWLEIQRSLEFIQDRISSLPSGEVWTNPAKIKPGNFAVSLVEGWRGEICHLALTDDQGKFLHYKVVDPSFHNWFGLALTLRNEQISNFPLCNKSFNLSYCGHDL